MPKQKPTTKKQYVIFAGGETAGPVIPLLSLAKYWQSLNPNICPIFLDRKTSVAAHIVPKQNFEFKKITAGKLRRYVSIKNILSPLLILIGIFQSLFLLMRLRPIVVIGAGGYVQVPVMIAAWILRIPRVIHQLDIVPTFSNRLTAPIADRITVTFEKSIRDFSQGTGFEKDYSHTKIFWTGSPCDLDEKTALSSKTKQEAAKIFNLNPKWPTIFVLGGGSGATGLNKVISENISDLLEVAQIIHGTGKGKMVELPHDEPEIHERYHQYEFIDRRDLAYAAADLVISRAGIGTIVDLATLSKTSIIVPMPRSHQEENAQFLYENDAAIVLDQEDIEPGSLGRVVQKIFLDAKLQKKMQDNIRKIIPGEGSGRMLKVITDLIESKS